MSLQLELSSLCSQLFTPTSLQRRAQKSMVLNHSSGQAKQGAILSSSKCPWHSIPSLTRITAQASGARLDSVPISDAVNDSGVFENLYYDVVIVGAGIIGLTIANKLLTTTNLSVTLVDAAKPCSGATGAGQGYVWLGHKTPGAISWPLSRRANCLWYELAEELRASGVNPQMAIGYKRTGSLVFGTRAEHVSDLKARTDALNNHGVRAKFLDSDAMHEVEPLLDAGEEGSAVFTFDDIQIDAQLAVSYISEENRKYCSSGRFQEIFHDPVVSFLWSDKYGHVAGVQTKYKRIYSSEKVIMAAGAWSGNLMKNAFDKLSLPFALATKPRKGHLLVLEGLSQVALRHGLMEFAYEKLADSADDFGIASTAALDAQGRLLLGSSRQFTGFDFSLQYDVMEGILKKAAKYLPILRSIHLAEALKTGTARIGHRPYVPDGRPMIGEVPGLEGLLLSTGHEGEGLTLSLATAEMVVNMICPGEQIVDPSPFSPAGRLVPESMAEAKLH